MGSSFPLRNSDFLGEPVFGNAHGFQKLAQTVEFTKQADAIWSESERMEFIGWIARYPFSVDVIPGADGLRKVRLKVAGKGKRGGVRVIYFNRSAEGRIYPIAIYRKADRSKIDPSELPEFDR